jgi:hypothetical protein
MTGGARGRAVESFPKTAPGLVLRCDRMRSDEMWLVGMFSETARITQRIAD